MSRRRQRPRRFNRHERKIRYKKKLERLADSSTSFPYGAVRIDKNRWWTCDKESTLYVKRIYRDNHTPGASKRLKMLSNRKTRRYTGDVSSGNWYRKIFDYWWNLT